MKLKWMVLLVALAAIPARSAEEKHDHNHDHDHGHANEVKLTADAIKQAGIRIEPVKKHVLSSTFTVPARVAFNAEAMAHVGSPVMGRVVEIKVGVGDAVKQGDELLIIESAELGQSQSEYLQKRTELAVATTAEEPAKLAYERAKKLYEQSQGIALGEVQKREAELKAAEGRSLSAKASLVAAQNRLSLLGMTPQAVKELEEKGTLSPRLSISAPITGRVIEREVTRGELVSPDKDRLMVLADTDTMWVLADVPEARLPQVSVGTLAHIHVAAIADGHFEGKVTQVAPALNPDTRAGRVRIEIAKPNAAARPGMFASAILTAASEDKGEAVLAVPDEAVQNVEGGPAVFVPVEGEENTFAARAITIGKPVGAMMPVLSGLKEGESIVVSGSFILKAELGKSEASHQH